jgi:hypothetical protein
MTIQGLILKVKWKPNSQNKWNCNNKYPFYLCPVDTGSVGQTAVNAQQEADTSTC